MITDINIKNFLSHKDSKLKLSEGLNIIVGNSDCGKSAVLNALNWGLFNEPSGYEFRSFFAKPKDTTSVEININDHNIQRIRSKSENCYIVDDLKLSALGKGLPDEVSNVTKLTDINVHNQFDGFFLINESPGNIGRILNKIIGLEIIDDSIRNANTEIKSLSKEISFLEKSKYDFENQLDDLQWVDAAEKSIERLKKKLTKLDDLDTKLDDIIPVENKLVENYEIIYEIESKLDIEQYLNKISKTISKYSETKVTLSDLKTSLTEITTLEEKIEKIDEKLKVEDAITKLSKMASEYVDMVINQKDMEDLLTTIEDKELSISSIDRIIKKTDRNLEKLLKSIDICPVCGKEM